MRKSPAETGPERPGYTEIRYRVPYADSDRMGVVYYANYLVYFERLRNELLRHLGFPYLEMESGGWQLPVIEAHIDYRRPARYDDLLTFGGWLEVVSPVRLKACCEIRRDTEPLAAGHTIHVCIRAESGRPCRLPPQLLTILEKLLQAGAAS